MFIKEVFMDKDAFVLALQMATGMRTQKKFAKECGISPQYFSRLMKGDTVPNISTLAKIAAHADNGITLEKLRNICGYSDSSSDTNIDNFNASNSNLIDTKHAKDWTYVLGLVSEASKGYTSASLDDYLYLVLSIFRNLEKNNYLPEDIDAELVGEPKEDGNRIVAEADFTVNRLNSPNIERIKTVISGIPTHDKDTVEYTDMIFVPEAGTLQRCFPNAIDPSAVNSEKPIDFMKCYAEFKRRIPYIGGSAKTDIAARISITDDDVVEANLFEGYGFYVNEVSEEKVKEAILRLSKESTTQIHEETSDEEFLQLKMDVLSSKHTSKPHSKKHNYLEIYADMLSEIYGINFRFIDTDESFKTAKEIGSLYTEHLNELKDNRSLIMVDYVAICNGEYDKATTLSACNRAAMLLGVRKYGQVYYKALRIFRREPEYSTDFPDDKFSTVKKEFSNK